MNSTKQQARAAGILYLLVAITAPLGLIYVPLTLIVPGDATATANRLRTSETLFRLGMGSELFHQTINILLALALYRLFKAVSAKHAALLVAFVLVPVAIMFLNVLNEIAALVLVGGEAFLSVFEARQLDALAFLFLQLHNYGIVIAQIFWGLWLFPFGTLAMRSGFIPVILGVLLMIAGCAHLASAFTTLLLPRYAELVARIALIPQLGELPMIFWLVIWGAKAQRSGGPALSPAGG